MTKVVLNVLSRLYIPFFLVHRRWLIGRLALSVAFGFAGFCAASVMTFDTNSATNWMAGGSFVSGSAYEEDGLLAMLNADYSDFRNQFDGTTTPITSYACYFHGTDSYIEFSLTNGIPFNLESFDLISNGYTTERWVETSRSAGVRTIIGGPTTWEHKTFSGPMFTDIAWFRIATPGNATVVDNICVSPAIVSNIVPSRGATRIPTNAIVSITFLQEMDASSLTTNTFQLRDSNGNLVSATVSYDPGSLTVTLTPLEGLTEAEKYAATVSGDARLQAGDIIGADYSWCFWTTGMLANVVWVGGNGDWNTEANWSTGTVPGPNDDVLIDYMGEEITVTHSVGHHQIRSLRTWVQFQVSGGSLSVAEDWFVERIATLSGGTVRGGAVRASDGAALVVSGSGTLDGVRVAGELDVGRTFSESVLVVTNGLVLDGTCYVGNPTNGNWGGVRFDGSQTLGGSGTVVFGAAADVWTWWTGNLPLPNTLWLGRGGSALTVGAGVTVRGQNGILGAYTGVPWYGPADVAVTNLGTIAADVAGGTILIQAAPLSNRGQVGALNGGSLWLDGAWENSGVLSADGAALQFNGTWRNGGLVAATNAVVSLSGVVATGDLGAWERSGGSVSLCGTLLNAGSALDLDGPLGPLVLAGGRISGGTAVATNGAALVVSGSGTLDGVRVAGELDVGRTFSESVLVVTNGLVLDGTCYVGNPTNGNWGGVRFDGSQTLGGNGTVVFGAAANAWTWWTGNLPLPNTLWLGRGGSALTVGAGVTVRGQNGILGAYTGVPWYGPADVAVTNLGTIAADVAGGTILIQAAPLSNRGQVGALNGGSLWVDHAEDVAGFSAGPGCGLRLDGVWENTGVLSADGAALQFNGTWRNGGLVAATNAVVSLSGVVATGDLGAWERSGGSVSLCGTLLNAGSALDLDGPLGPLVLAGGRISGGTAVATNGSALVVNGSGTLDGVEVDGELDVGRAYSESVLVVTNGLTLDGTCYVGNPTNGNWGGVRFDGSQTLGGSGTVVFGAAADVWTWWTGNLPLPNTLWLGSGGSALTVGAGVTVRGQNGILGAYTGVPWYGPADVAVTNLGTIAADVAGGTVSVVAQPFSSAGVLKSAYGARLSLPKGVSINDPGSIVSQAGGSVSVSGALTGGTRQAKLYDPKGNLTFNSGSNALEVMSLDLGNVAEGYNSNFAYGTITLTSGAAVSLTDQSDNAAGTGAECVYVNSLIVPSGSTLNLNGQHLYARLAQYGGTVTNGAVSQVPCNGGALTAGSAMPGTISAAGALNEYTFYGRSGHHYSVVVDAGSGSVLAPKLNYAEVRLFDPATNCLSVASNTTSGATVTLSNVALAADGTYRVLVRAPADHSSSTGNFLITVWDVTPDVSTLTLNQLVSGRIETPYAVDEWHFSANANTQVRFNLLNVSSPGVAFDLTGPDGWTGFSNLSASSGLVTLPASGAYTLTAHGTGGAYGIAYAFKLETTAQKAVTPGSGSGGTLAGTGDAQLFKVDLPSASPMRITLALTNAGAHVEMYAKLGAPPTRSVFDYKYEGEAAQVQKLLIPPASAGTWYILIYVDYLPQPTAYTLEIVTQAVFLESVSPAKSAAIVDTVLHMRGAGFGAGTAVRLVASGGSLYAPSSVAAVQSGTEMNAVFPANTVPEGVYSVSASSGGVAECLTNALTMYATGYPEFHAHVIVPGAVGYHQPSTIYIEYSNSGTVDMPAPLLEMTATQNGLRGAFLTLDQSRARESYWTDVIPSGYDTTVTLLASGATAGLLLPGETRCVPVHYAGWRTSQWEGSRPLIYFTLGVVKADDIRLIDWVEFEKQVRPVGMDDATWTTVLSRLQSQIGPAWGDYVAALAANATQPAFRGLSTGTIAELFEQEMYEAAGYPGNCINGFVTDVASGQPLPGVAIHDISTDLRSVAEAITGTNGFFSLEGLYEGEHNLSLSGYFIDSDPVVTITNGADVLGVQIQAHEAGHMTGQVRAEADGRALTNVLVFCAGELADHSFQTFTDNDGEYTIDTLPADTYTLNCSADGFVGGSTSGVVVALGQTLAGVDFNLVTGATISGIVRRQSDSMVLSNAVVSIQSLSTNYLQAVFTDDNGLYRLANLPADTYTMECTHGGYAGQISTGVQVRVGQVLGGNDFSLTAGASIAGTLVNASDSSVLSGADLLLIGDDGNPFYAVTDAAGAFVFTDLPAGSYTLQYSAASALPAELDLTVTEGQTLGNVELRVHAGCVISGTVTSAVSGEPLANVTMVAITPTGDVIETQSDAGGHYWFSQLTTGSYQVRVLGSPVNAGVTVNLEQQDETVTPDAVSVNYAASVDGVLSDALGNPIQGSVLLYQSGQLIMAAQCDAGGRYGFLLMQAGQFELQGQAQAGSFEPVTLSVSSGDNLVQNIMAGVSSLTLSVSSADEDSTGAMVNLYQYTSNGLVYSSSAIVDTTRLVAFNGLAEGNYRVIVATTNDFGATIDEFVAGPVTEADVTLTPTFNVTGLVTNAGGQPIGGASIFLTDTDRNLKFVGSSQTDGTYSVTGVLPGTYTFAIIVDGFQALVQKDVLVSHATPLNGALIASTTTLIGQMVDDVGNACAFGSVNVFDAGGQWIGGAQTYSDGTFAITTAYGTDLRLVASTAGGGTVSLAIPILSDGVTDVGSVVVTEVAVFKVPASAGSSMSPLDINSTQPMVVAAANPASGSSFPSPPDEIWSPTYIVARARYEAKLMQYASFKEDRVMQPPPVCNDPATYEYNQSIYKEWLAAKIMVDGYRDLSKSRLNMLGSELMGVDAAYRQQDAALKSMMISAAGVMLDSGVVLALCLTLGVEGTMLEVLVTCVAEVAEEIYIALLQRQLPSDKVSAVLKLKYAVDAIMERFEKTTVGKWWKRFGPIASLGKYIYEIHDELGVLGSSAADVRSRERRTLSSEAEEAEALEQLARYYSAMVAAAKKEYKACPCGHPAPQTPTIPIGDGQASGVGSVDPNAKIGPAGFGVAGFVAGGALLPYRIDFENATNATAPAQIVQISDMLSPNLDWSTFELSEIAFGDTLLEIPAGSQHYEDIVPMTYNGVDFDVWIFAGIDFATGEVYAEFYSLDPDTLLPPNILIGFLPPENGTGIGQGHVSYMIRPLDGLPTGTEIRNIALITFDEGEIIATNQRDPHDASLGTDPTLEALVTIDADAPSSQVFALPAKTDEPSFAVSWSGSDAGGGIASYDIYVSTGDLWRVWLSGTTNTAAIFDGERDHSYAFYSLARDGAGNVEAAPSVADAVIAVSHGVITLGEAVEQEGRTWTTDGDAPWGGQSDVSHDGVDAAQSGAIGDRQYSDLSAQVLGSGTLSFWWKVSSERYYDWLWLYIDDEVWRAISGTNDWQQVSVHVDGSGLHTFVWEYRKDGDTAQGLDAAWVDQVAWLPDAGVTNGFIRWVDAKGLDGDAVTLFSMDRNGDGAANGFEYACGTNWLTGQPLLTVVRNGSQPVAQVPRQEPETLDFVTLYIECCTNLSASPPDWTVPVQHATNDVDRPPLSDWYEPLTPLDRAFFRLKATLK